MFGEFANVKISGISSVVPKNTFDNLKYIEGIEDKKTKKQTKLTGVIHRHLLSEEQTILTLASEAGEKLLNYLNWNKEEIRVLVFVTQTPELIAPSTAMLLQKELGIGYDCSAFDVNLGCSGYISGLQIVSALLQSTGGKGLLLVGDGRYRPPDREITKDSLLFGDGVSATGIELTTDSPPLRYSQYTDGSRYDLLYIAGNGKVYHDGNAVLLFSMNEVCDSIRNSKTVFGVEEDDIDYYVFHQTQKMAVEGIAFECGLPMDKVLISYDEYGNTSGASIPVTLCSNVGRLEKKDEITVFLCGYGIGLAWNTAVIKLNTKDIIPIIEI